VPPLFVAWAPRLPLAFPLEPAAAEVDVDVEVELDVVVVVGTVVLVEDEVVVVLLVDGTVVVVVEDDVLVLVEVLVLVDVLVLVEVEPVVVDVECVVEVVGVVVEVLVDVVVVVPTFGHRLTSWLCGPGADGPSRTSPSCRLWPFVHPLTLIEITTHGCDDEPVRWQTSTFAPAVDCVVTDECLVVCDGFVFVTTVACTDAECVGWLGCDGCTGCDRWDGWDGCVGCEGWDGFVRVEDDVLGLVRFT
jgi:hypothetical protein